MKVPIKQCPHCGSEIGFYFRERYKGCNIFNLTYEGEDGDNSAMYDSAEITHRSKYTYCQHCDKRLFKREELG